MKEKTTCLNWQRRMQLHDCQILFCVNLPGKCGDMEVLNFLSSIFLIFVSSRVNHLLAEFTTDDCAALGFNKATLLCSVCDQLPQFKLEDLSDPCNQCCNKDEVLEVTKKYAKARLEVCTCKYGAYPQIQAFVKSDKPGKFPNLSIRYVRGMDPIIKLMDKEGNVIEVLAIENWNTDSIEEFLKTHLEPVGQEINLDNLNSNLI